MGRKICCFCPALHKASDMGAITSQCGLSKYLAKIALSNDLRPR